MMTCWLYCDEHLRGFILQCIHSHGFVFEKFTNNIFTEIQKIKSFLLPFYFNFFLSVGYIRGFQKTYFWQMWTKLAIISAYKILINKKICLKLLLLQGNRVKTAFRVECGTSAEMSSYSTSNEMFQMSVLQIHKEYSFLLPKSNQNYGLVESHIFVRNY